MAPNGFKMKFPGSVLFLSLTGFFACSEHSAIKEASTVADTVFLDRYVSEPDSIGYVTWTQVFIENDPQSEYYKRVVDFPDFEMYSDNHDMSGLRHFDTSALPDEWVPLYTYKGKYYVYHPGDVQIRVALCDSLFIAYGHEPVYYSIDNFHPAGENHFKVNVAGMDNSLRSWSFDIYLIDPVQKIAVWSWPGFKDDRYFLMVARENARKFPIVVNTGNVKPMEYEFDETDYKELLKGF